MPPILSLRHYNHDQIDHSHGHAQLVFGLRGQLEFEMDGHGCRIGPQLLAVVPSDTRHACDSRDGSHCLIVDVPGGDWLSRRLGHHLDPGRRLLDRPSALRLTPAQSQLVGWGWRRARSMIRLSTNRVPRCCFPASLPAVSPLARFASCRCRQFAATWSVTWRTHFRSRIWRALPACLFPGSMRASWTKPGLRRSSSSGACACNVAASCSQVRR